MSAASLDGSLRASHDAVLSLSRGAPDMSRPRELGEREHRCDALVSRQRRVSQLARDRREDAPLGQSARAGCRRASSQTGGRRSERGYSTHGVQQQSQTAARRSRAGKARAERVKVRRRNLTRSVASTRLAPYPTVFERRSSREPPIEPGRHALSQDRSTGSAAATRTRDAWTALRSATLEACVSIQSGRPPSLRLRLGSPQRSDRMLRRRCRDKHRQCWRWAVLEAHLRPDESGLRLRSDSPLTAHHGRSHACDARQLDCRRRRRLRPAEGRRAPRYIDPGQGDIRAVRRTLDVQSRDSWPAAGRRQSRRIDELRHLCRNGRALDSKSVAPSPAARPSTSFDRLSTSTMCSSRSTPFSNACSTSRPHRSTRRRCRLSSCREAVLAACIVSALLA